MGYPDARDVGWYPSGWKPDFKRMKIVDYEGVEWEAEVIVCPICQGRGTHVNPSIDANGITGSEMAELGEEFQDMYFSGSFDQKCNGCSGRTTVLDCTQMSEAREDRVSDMRVQWAEDGYPQY